MKKVFLYLIIIGLMLLSVAAVLAKDNKVLMNGKETSAKKEYGNTSEAVPDTSKTPSAKEFDPIPDPDKASSKDTKKDSKNTKLKGKNVMVDNKGSISKTEEEKTSTKVNKKLKREQQPTKQIPR